MIATLITLTLRGTLATLLVWMVDRLFGSKVRPAYRRPWWVLVCIIWLLPLRLPRSELVSRFSLPDMFVAGLLEKPAGARNQITEGMPVASSERVLPWATLLMALWLAGLALFLTIVAARTYRTSRRWSGERLSTDPELLDLLEDCKATTGVSAPIGLVITSEVSTPALLGWLRPRILLPRSLVDAITQQRLRAILLHELAHFRSADIPVNWFFTLAQAVNWFNPVISLAVRRWRYLCELNADASAMVHLPETDREGYGDALLCVLRPAGQSLHPVPRGALALGESLNQLKERITFVAQGAGQRLRGAWLAVAVVIALLVLLVLPSRTLHARVAEPTVEAANIASAESRVWIALVDEGKYDQSWAESAAFAKKSLSCEKWRELCGKTRSFVGKIVRRELHSAEARTDLVRQNGSVLRGEYVVIQYNTVFENLSSARETVPMFKDTDGRWRPCGYLLNPQ